MTTLTYNIGNPGHVTLGIFDPIGRVVADLVNDTVIPGEYAETWNASGFADGIYYCRLSADNITKINKVLVLK